MLKQLYRAIVISRSASAARQTLLSLTDSHLNDMGFSRDTFVEGIKARISAELDAAEAANNFAVPVNENLLGAV
jgi:uncharacterized protein YjiS (DUF1127 family)